MRTTVDIPDPIYRELKSRAAAEGTSVKQIILRSVQSEFRRPIASAITIASAASRTRAKRKFPVIRSKNPGSLKLWTGRVCTDTFLFPDISREAGLLPAINMVVSLPMRTTVDIPDPIYRELKTRAAAEGETVKALLLRGAEAVLSQPKKGNPKRLRFPILNSGKPGTLDIDNEKIYDIIGFP